MPQGRSLLVIETGLTLLSIFLAFAAPRTGSRIFSKLERFFGKLARRQGLSALGVGVAACLLRLLILPATPIPRPYAHDEFSHLLAADTFAAGRLTNPTHPMWVHFESFHIEHLPTYMSMYFPAQGFVLATGKVLFGHPWFGVWLSVGIMCSVLCWMLQGWLPPGWALLGAFFAVLRLALFSYWEDSYFGGAVPAIGGALLFGALPRLSRSFSLRHSIVLALGICILALSRPYEGLVCTLVVLVTLCWRMRHSAVSVRRFLPQITGGLALVTLTAAFLLYYNKQVFGSPLTFPYDIDRATYMAAPQFVWQHPKPEPSYRHAVIRDFYVDVQLADFLRFQTVAGFIEKTAKKIAVILLFFFGVALLPSLIVLPRVVRDRRMRVMVISASVFGLALVLNAWMFPHYAAPLTAVIYVLLLQSMRHLRLTSPAGLGLIRFTPVLCLILAGLRLCAGPLNLRLDRWPAMWYGQTSAGLSRAGIIAELDRQPGQQLAIVRYAANHDTADEWVYNAAEIDRAKIVWAREMNPAEDRKLLRYFRDRQVWLVQPDCNPPKLSPYKPGLVTNACNRSHR